ncbi:MAG: glycosyltransferase [Deltaproteobacteria bacterium]|nr:glycosyltransferase [Deltaproteobacteria bacterium]
MKIAFLAGYNVIHTVRWVNSLCERGHDVHLLSLHRKGDRLDPRVKKVHFPFPPPAGYYLNAPFVRSYLRKIKPDLVNAHYASGYGTLGRLSGFHPYILSVWGSDVYDFPNYSARNRKLVIKNLAAANMVCSTSHAMARVTEELCPDLAAIHITPFGVDTKKFIPDLSCEKIDTITIGTVKRIENKYGIDILVRSFADIYDTLQTKNPKLADKLRLLIVGDGTERERLIKLAVELGVGELTQFTGKVAYADVPVFLSKMDIYAAFSRLDSESFGVAILEASGCGLPVVVSDVDGPAEVVENGKTGLIVPREDVTAGSAALGKLVSDDSLRSRLGAAGREHVVAHYDWEKSVDIMEGFYRKVFHLRKGEKL